MTTRILIAEDDHRIAAFAKKGLRAAGFGVSVERDGPSALAAARSGQYDLLVLDRGLPDMDGVEVHERLCAEGNGIPVVILAPRESAEDTTGPDEATDYLSKPFQLDELLARVRALLDSQTGMTSTDTLVSADLALDLTTRRVRAVDIEADLSAREFALLREFLLHPEQVLSREQLLNRVWGFDHGSNVVDVYVRYLRQKIGRHRLETVRGTGYRLTSQRRK